MNLRRFRQHAERTQRNTVRVLLGVLTLLIGCATAPLPAQQTPAPREPAGVPAPTGVSPRSAFLRAVALPGWGHASIGAYHRGAFYFVVEGASAWMLVMTRRRYADVEGRLRFQEEAVRAGLAAAGVTDPAEVLRRLDAHATVRDLRSLREARRQQREDWTAISVFLVLLSGVDAYVSAHLRDFPAPLSVDTRPAGSGRLEVSLQLTLPR